MIHSYSLHTSEIDDIDLAVQEIEAQLQGITLCRNTVGIALCHYDFVEYDIVEALGRVLPFPFVGETTFYQASSHITGMFELNMIVLTSDDVRFSVSMSRPLEGGNFSGPLTDAYREAAAGEEKPSMMFSFSPVGKQFLQDDAIALLSGLSGNAPNFGSVAIDETGNFEKSYTFCNGKSARDAYVMLLLFGDVKAHFYHSGFPEGNLSALTAEVTRVEESRIIEVDGAPLSHYLEKIGLMQDGEINGALMMVPMFIKKPGCGELICRIMDRMDEDGAGVMVGAVEEGDTLHVGTWGIDEIRETAGEALEKAMAETGKGGAFFIFSCFMRYLGLGTNASTELDCAMRTLGDDTHYMLGYSGGEICPFVCGNEVKNTFFNGTFIICVLQ